MPTGEPHPLQPQRTRRAHRHRRSPAGAPRVVRVQTANNAFQRLEALRDNRTKRHRYREFLAEGVRPISRAHAQGWRFRALVFAAGRPLSAWASHLLAGAEADELLELPPSLMARLSERDDTSELIAVVRMPPDDLARVAFRPDGLAVVFDRPNSPGNLGSLIRSCDALGADGLVVTGHGADPYHPQAVRGSMGSLFALPTVWQPSQREVAQWIDALATTAAGRRPQIVGASAEAGARPDEVDLTRPTVLIVGNETHGLSRASRELCGPLVRIPMGGAADSLNVACAASILLYEAWRQRREIPPVPPADVSPTEAEGPRPAPIGRRA